MWKGQCLEIFYFLFFLYLFSLLLVILRICQQKISANSFERIQGCTLINDHGPIYSTVGWSDLALFAIFECGHITADQVYFQKLGRAGSARTSKLIFYYFIFFYICLASGGVLPLCPEILQYTQCPVLRVFHCERCRILTRDHRLSVGWNATNEPPHLLMSHHISYEPPHILIFKKSLGPLLLFSENFQMLSFSPQNGDNGFGPSFTPS